MTQQANAMIQQALATKLHGLSIKESAEIAKDYNHSAEEGEMKIELNNTIEKYSACMLKITSR